MEGNRGRRPPPAKGDVRGAGRAARAHAVCHASRRRRHDRRRATLRAGVCTVRGGPDAGARGGGAGKGACRRQSHTCARGRRGGRPEARPPPAKPLPGTRPPRCLGGGRSRPSPTPPPLNPRPAAGGASLQTRPRGVAVGGVHIARLGAPRRPGLTPSAIGRGGRSPLPTGAARTRRCKTPSNADRSHPPCHPDRAAPSPDRPATQCEVGGGPQRGGVQGEKVFACTQSGGSRLAAITGKA